MNPGERGALVQRWPSTTVSRGAVLSFGPPNNWKRHTWFKRWLNVRQRWSAIAEHRRSSTEEIVRKETNGAGAGLLSGITEGIIGTDGASQLSGDGLLSMAVGLETDYGPQLHGFAQRVATCNAGREKKSDFFPFMVDGKVLGYVHYGFAEHLRRFPEVFSFEDLDVNVALPAETGNGCIIAGTGIVSVHSRLKSPRQRTEAIKVVLQALASEGLIPGWRNELLPVILEYGQPPLMSMERAAVNFFGGKAYGVFVNGYVNIDGEKYMWVAERSVSKPTFPGRLDHMVAGVQPVGINAKANVIKECDEEAGIPQQVAEKAVPVGAVSYETIVEQNLVRDVFFGYDLELPVDFVPYNKDGEVQRFYRLPVSEIIEIISKTERVKPNCILGYIDFFIRHGYITPEQKGYLSLLKSLRIGELL